MKRYNKKVIDFMGKWCTLYDMTDNEIDSPRCEECLDRQTAMRQNGETEEEIPPVLDAIIHIHVSNAFEHNKCIDLYRCIMCARPLMSEWFTWKDIPKYFKQIIFNGKQSNHISTGY